LCILSFTFLDGRRELGLLLISSWIKV
jgi:hypothetical protein